MLKKQSPPPRAVELAARFADRFSGLARAHGEYKLPKGAKPNDRGKVSGHGITHMRGASVADFEAHLAGKKHLGVVPIRDDGTVVWAAIDVDDYTVPPAQIAARVAELKLPLIVCATKSGGAHCYLFLTEPVKATHVREKLKGWATALGYPAAEIFPKQERLESKDDVGSWINMPYHGNTRWALRNGGPPLDPAAFLDLTDQIALSAQALQAHQPTIPEAASEEAPLFEAPPCLQQLAAEGFAPGTRNKALFNLGVFLRKRYGDTWAEHLGEMNAAYVQPPLPSRELTQITKHLTKKDYNYTCKDAPLAAVCNRAVCLTRRYGIASPKESGIDAGAMPRIRSLREIIEDPEFNNGPEVVAHNFAWRGRCTLLVGREKSGKTTLMAFIAARVSAGREVFVDEPTNPLTVLWCALEGHIGDVSWHLTRFGADPGRVFVVDQLPKGLTSLRLVCEATQAGLLIIDTLSSLADRLVEEFKSDSQGWTQLWNELGRIVRDVRVGSLVSHHVRKSDGRYRDSTAIGAGADMILEMEEEQSTRTFKAPRGRWDVSPFAIRLDEAEERFVLASADATLPESIYDYVKRHEGCSKNDVRKNVKNASSAKKDTAIAQLIADGALTLGKGKKANNDGLYAASGRRPRPASPPPVKAKGDPQEEPL